MALYTNEDLKIMQAWSLERKIQVSQTRIMEWYMRWNGQVYVSFSGGKDSTVLLDLARRVSPDIEAVFCDTGLEYPEIREFVKSKENVTWLYPIKYVRRKREWVRTNFREVIEEHGYPIISKEVALKVKETRSKPDGYASQSFDENSPKNIMSKGRYSLVKYRYLLDAPFKISDECCNAMKKAPAKIYERKTNKKPIIGTMASESRVRRTVWLKQGCNAFTAKRPTSQPLSFWTEQDILTYLKRFNIPYCSVYGDIVEDSNGKLITTGENRTGCMFCMFGVHLEKEPNKFQRMAITHPIQYDYCINKLGCGKVLDYIGVDYSHTVEKGEIKNGKNYDFDGFTKRTN